MRMRLNTDTPDVLDEIQTERDRQDAKWGEQNHEDGTGGPFFERGAKLARIRCENAFKEARGTWEHILSEEFYEALAESDPTKLREELIQCGAVICAWVEAIDRRGGK